MGYIQINWGSMTVSQYVNGQLLTTSRPFKTVEGLLWAIRIFKSNLWTQSHLLNLNLTNVVVGEGSPTM